MTTPNETIQRLAAALDKLLAAKDSNGDRIVYGEHREPVRDTVVIEQCRVCDEVDGHRDDCVVATAEQALRQVRNATS